MPIESRLFPDVGSSELTRSLGIDTDNRPPAIDRGSSRLTSELEENGTRVSYLPTIYSRMQPSNRSNSQSTVVRIRTTLGWQSTTCKLLSTGVNHRKTGQQIRREIGSQRA